MLHVVFRLRRDRALTRLSEVHPGTRLAVWCNLERDVVEIRGETAGDVRRAAEELARTHEDVERIARGSDGRSETFLFTCPLPPGGTVSSVVEAHGGLIVPPIVVEEGFDTFRMIAFDEKRLPSFFRALRRLGEVEVVAKRPADSPLVEEQFLLSSAELLGDLTPKQGEALLLAVRHGYYSVPRRATMQDIAAEVGRPRTTLEEHLRKAEGKILTNLSPLVALRLGEAAGPARGRRAGRRARRR